MWHEDILRAHEIYGPVVRINHHEVSKFVDADPLKRVYRHQNPSEKVSTAVLSNARPPGMTRGRHNLAMARSPRNKISNDILYTAVVLHKPTQ